MPERFYAVREGLTIRGDMYPGPGKAVIISHGFLGDETGCREYAQALSDEGFLTVTFDFCGGGPNSTSDGRSEDMSVLTEVRDLTAVTDRVKELFPEKEIVLLGLSQGGFVSALTAAGRGDISSLVLVYPAFCIPDDASRGDMLLFRFDPKSVPEIIGEVPMKIGREYALSMQGFDWEGAIAPYRGRVLLVHGTADDIVSIAYSRRAVELYRDAVLIELPGASHGFSGKDLAKALEDIKEFLRN